MPGPEMIIDPLASIGHEGLQLIQLGLISGWTYDHDKRTGIEGQKSLTTEGVVFQVVDPARQIEFPAIHQADDGTRLLTDQFNIGQRMIAIGHALVDREGVVSLELDHIAEG